jgi:hypothetical protein
MHKKNSTNKNSNNRKKMANALFEAFRAFASASLAKEVIEDQVLPGLKSLISESGGIQVEPSFKTLVQSMIQDMKNNISTIEKSVPTNPKISNPINSTGHANQPTTSNDNTTVSNISNNINSSTSNTGGSLSNSNNTTNMDKGSTRKNLFEKLDAAASITAASITSSLTKVDFDKAIPKWTWKNK